MEEKLTIYQQYMLEDALFFIGSSPYVMICSDDNEILNYCQNEILKRIDYIKCIYDYPDAPLEFEIPKWLNEIINIEYKSMMFMNFDETIERRIKLNPEIYNEEYINANVYPKFTVDEYAAWVKLVYFREYLCGYSVPIVCGHSISIEKPISSIIVLCSNKFKNIDVADLHGFIRIYSMDSRKSYLSEDEMKHYIENFRKIDYNNEHKEKIKIIGRKK